MTHDRHAKASTARGAGSGFRHARGGDRHRHRSERDRSSRPTQHQHPPARSADVVNDHRQVVTAHRAARHRSTIDDHANAAAHTNDVFGSEHAGRFLRGKSGHRARTEMGESPPATDRRSAAVHQHRRHLRAVRLPQARRGCCRQARRASQTRHPRLPIVEREVDRAHPRFDSAAAGGRARMLRGHGSHIPLHHADGRDARRRLSPGDAVDTQRVTEPRPERTQPHPSDKPVVPALRRLLQSLLIRRRTRASQRAHPLARRTREEQPGTRCEPATATCGTGSDLEQTEWG